MSYLKLGGKSLRPAVMLLSCGAVGGDEQVAIPAAAGIEVYHTWTLVHDDVIDKDPLRRGKPTVHVEFAQRGAQEFGLTGDAAEHYGRVIAILAGDAQQSWSYMLFHDLHTQFGVDPRLVLRLVGELATDVQLLLLEGETLDVQFTSRDAFNPTEDQILAMLRKKTGVLYEFAGRAGAMIGLGDASGNTPEVAQIARFCGTCGTAFQLQDDILGVVGETAITGKPVGADLREGKMTLLALHTLREAVGKKRETFLHAFGRSDASEEAILAATAVLRDVEAIQYTQSVAQRMVEGALTEIEILAPTPYRDLLITWGQYMIERRW